MINLIIYHSKFTQIKIAYISIDWDPSLIASIVRDESSVARLLRGSAAAWKINQQKERVKEKNNLSATDSTLVRSSVRQTVDLFVWVYMILSHSPIHVRFSCVFFTRDWLGLEPQRQRACQQGAGKRLVFNLLRPDSIAWNCGREARSFSPDSLWIFGSRIFVPFFFTSPSLFRFLLSPPPSLSCFPTPSSFLFSLSAFSLSCSPFFHESLFHFRTFTSDIYLGNLSRLKLLSTLRFYLVRFYTRTARPSGRIFRRASVIRAWCTWKDWLAGNVDFVQATLYRPDYRQHLDYLHIFLRRKDLMYLRDFFERGSKKFEFELTGGLILDCSNVDFCSRLRKMLKMIG